MAYGKKGMNPMMDKKKAMAKDKAKAKMKMMKKAKKK